MWYFFKFTLLWILQFWFSFADIWFIFLTFKFTPNGEINYDRILSEVANLLFYYILNFYLSYIYISPDTEIALFTRTPSSLMISATIYLTFLLFFLHFTAVCSEFTFSVLELWTVLSWIFTWGGKTHESNPTPLNQKGNLTSIFNFFFAGLVFFQACGSVVFTAVSQQCKTKCSTRIQQTS